MVDLKNDEAAEKEIRASQHALAMVEDTRHQRRLLQDLRTRRLKPSTECMLWAFAIGRPVEDEDDEPMLEWFDQHIS